MKTKFQMLCTCAKINYNIQLQEYESLKWCYAPLYNEPKPTLLKAFVGAYNYQHKRRKDIIFNSRNYYGTKPNQYTYQELPF